MKVRFELFLVFLILIMSLLPAMWNEAVNYSYNSSYLMKNYPDAAEWLVQNMDYNESAIVPMREVFETLEPSLKGRLIDYTIIWKGANVFLAADNTMGDILAVRKYLLEYLKQNKIRFMLTSVSDPYSAPLFNEEIVDELVLYEIDEFHSEELLWNDPITIYTYASTRRALLMLTFTEPAQYDIRGNVNLTFGPAGLGISYEGDSGVFIPAMLNSSVIEKLLLSVYFSEISRATTGNVVLYLDKNGNGHWDGWDIDTGISIPFPKIASEKGEVFLSQNIYKVGYDILQVGIILYSESPQIIYIKSITFFGFVT